MNGTVAGIVNHAQAEIILRDFLIKGSYNKSIDKAVHTDNSVSAEYFNAVVDLLAGMININK